MLKMDNWVKGWSIALLELYKMVCRVRSGVRSTLSAESIAAIGAVQKRRLGMSDSANYLSWKETDINRFNTVL